MDYRRGKRLVLTADAHGLNRGDVVEVIRTEADGTIVARCPRASRTVELSEDEVREES